MIPEVKIYRIHYDCSDDNYVWFRSDLFSTTLKNWEWIAIHKEELYQVKSNPLKWASTHLQSNNFNLRNLSNAIINDLVEL